MILMHITTVPLTLNFLRGQIGHMQDGGFEVHVVSSPGELLDEFARTEEVTAHAIAMERRFSPLRDLQALVRLTRLLWRVKPAIVHAQTPKAGLLGLLAAWLVRTPVRVYGLLGLPFLTKTGFARRLLRSSEWASCRLAHQVICVSQGTRQVAIDDGLCPPDKITVLLNGTINGIDALGHFNPAVVDPAGVALIRSNLGIPDGCPVIGFVGRIVRDKGVIELAAAWRLLRESFPHAHLLLVGPTETQDPIPLETEQQLRGDPRVHLVGFVPDQRPFYALMSVVVLPTYREGFPVTPLEAAALELPVVATSVPGCTEAVVDGVTGLLVPPYDAQALAQAIGRYLGDPVLARFHGQAGRQRMLADFQQEPLWDALYRTYAQLLSNSGLVPPTENGQDSTSKAPQPA